jgi:hypothetical protein
MNNQSFDIVCASEVEEFFYEDSNMPVPEGEPVGVEFYTPTRSSLVLSRGIYFSHENLFLD